MTPAPPVRRGFTLLEVLIVLILMGVASALVVPALRGAGPAEGRPLTPVATKAQREAIRRAETLRLLVDDAGAWSLRVARTSELLDSGQLHAAREASAGDVRGAWVFDALGGCVPLASDVAPVPFDALSCRPARSDERAVASAGVRAP